MSSDQWKASFGFSERMSTNMRLKTAFKTAIPELTSIELAAMASAAEEDIFARASSTNDYKDLCKQECADASKKHVPIGTTTSPVAAGVPPPANTNPFQDIGPYKAQYHASGLFSTLYQATDSNTGRTIAIKVTTPSNMSEPHDSAREARLLKLMKNADAVIPLLATQWIAGGHFLIILPFLPCDLGHLLDQHLLTARQHKVHLQAMFKALDHIHSHGIIHRDVKPSNLLSQGPDGPIYLADFGIAWHASDPASEPADEKITDVGTTCYRPPELLFGFKMYTEKLDMWAAGCVVAECLRDGRSLFDAGDLGSELALIRSIFTILGTPTNSTWPEACQMPDWGKMQFTEYSGYEWRDILPGAQPEEITLVHNLVQFQSTGRLSAAEALKDHFFKDI